MVTGVLTKREVQKVANILVCDDDKDIVEAISIYLEQEGYTIFKAYDGLDAINILHSQPVDLLIIDIMMPKLDGIRATLKIREENPLPIIILSAKCGLKGIWYTQGKEPETEVEYPVIQSFETVDIEELF